MNVRDFECRSYEQAVGLLRGKSTRTVCNNTIIAKGTSVGGHTVVSVYLHRHPVVRLYSDGKVILDSCGYRTVTTKDRINRCLPAGVDLSQDKGTWYLRKFAMQEQYYGGKGTVVPFVDGMTVPGTGG